MFKHNIIKMNVHSATYSCSVELYKQWFTLADFSPKWDISRSFLYVYIIYIAGRISAAVTAGDLILFSIYYSTKGTAKLRWVGRGGGGGGVIVLFRVPYSLEGCDVWGEGGLYYIIYQSLGGKWKDDAPGCRVPHLG